MSDRDKRRRSLRTARRARQFIDFIAITKADVSDLREKRPPDTAVTKLRTILEAGVVADDSVTVEEKTTFHMEYDNPNTGVGFSEYENEYE